MRYCMYLILSIIFACLKKQFFLTIKNCFMKKNLLKAFWGLLFSIIVFPGCQKVTKEANPETELQSAKVKPKNECRLTNLTYFDGDGEYNYHYNAKGLCDEWDIANYGLFRQEYDASGRLKISKLYDGTDLSVTIHFFYEGKKVVKEIWYDGNTSNIIDEVFYTYNSKGQMVRGESFLLDYYTINTWTPEGNTLSWKFFIGGSPYWAAFLTYNRPCKNPYLAVPGIEYGFPFINPTYNLNKWWASSEKIVIYDEFGNTTVSFDYDPSRTIWQVGHQNYPLSTTYFDLISQGWFPYTFEYENCEPGNSNRNSQIAQPSSLSSSATGKVNPMNLLKFHPSKSIKEQAQELRNQMKNLKPTTN